MLDRDGHAIANAKIYVKVVPLPSEEMDTEDDGVGGDYKPLAISGADGNYSIGSLSPGKLTMGAQADGYADAVRPGITLARDKANEVDFNVAPEERLQGTVVDEHASPVAKARVVARAARTRAPRSGARGSNPIPKEGSPSPGSTARAAS
mgnify:CR=1 FL=1